jgi:hypothetical protein
MVPYSSVISKTFDLVFLIAFYLFNDDIFQVDDAKP